MQSKTRLDKLLINQGYCRSRNQASELISLGLVEVKRGLHWSAVNKSSTTFTPDTQVRIADNPLQKYVSRAAIKLLGAVEKTSVIIKDLRALDVGQSTGGFTQILLEKGASEVVGIEVGRGQLAQPLRDNPRVICMEGVNARDLAKAMCSEAEVNSDCSSLPERAKAIQLFEFAVMDVSFISQTLILPELKKVLFDDAILLSLVKPQFETGSKNLTKGGIVKDSRALVKVEEKILACCATNGFAVLDYFPSKIKGTDGNQEFFLYAKTKKANVPN